MIAAGLLEAIAALLLDGLALATLIAGTHSAVLLQAQAAAAQNRAFRVRQVESLIDAATTDTAAAEGASLISAIGTNSVTLTTTPGHAATPFANGSKTTAIALVADETGLRLVHRLGRQTMTLLRGLPADSRLTVLDGTGASTRSPASAVLLHLKFGITTRQFAVSPGRR